MRIVIAAIGVVLGGCSTSTADPDVAHEDRPVMFASDAGVSADCATQSRALAGKVRSAYVAMDATSSRRAAKDLWTAMPETCRNGAWYLAAARLVAIDVKPLVAGSLTIDAARSPIPARCSRSPHATTRIPDNRRMKRVVVVVAIAAGTAHAAPTIDLVAANGIDPSTGYLTDLPKSVVAGHAKARDLDNCVKLVALDYQRPSSILVDVYLKSAATARSPASTPPPIRACMSRTRTCRRPPPASRRS